MLASSPPSTGLPLPLTHPPIYSNHPNPPSYQPDQTPTTQTTQTFQFNSPIISPSHRQYAQDGNHSVPSTPVHPYQSIGPSTPSSSHSGRTANFDWMNDPTVGTSLDTFSSQLVPNHVDLVETSNIPFGVSLTPSLHLHDPPPRYASAHIQACQQCAARVNQFCRFTTNNNQPQWTCVLCQTQQVFRSHINQYVTTHSPSPNTSNPSTLPVEFALPLIETVEPLTPNAAILPPTVFPPSAPTNPATNGFERIHPRSTGAGLNYVIIIDRNIPKADFIEFKRSLITLIKELPSDAGISLITFAHTVTIYDLTQNGIAAGNVQSGETGPTMEAMEEIIQEQGVHFPRVGHVLDTLLECLDSLEQSGSNSDQQKLFNPRAIGAAVEWAIARVQAGREYDSLVAESKPSSRLTSFSSSTSYHLFGSFSFTHFLLFTSGPPDFGPGETSLEFQTSENEAARIYYAEVGERARANSIQIDYCTYGMGHFACPIIRKLVEPTGGSIYQHKSLNHTFVSDLREILFRSIGYNGKVEMFFSPGLKVTRVIGGVAQLAEGQESNVEAHHSVPSTNESSSADSLSSSLSVNAHVNRLTLHLSNCRPDESISILFGLREDLPQDYVVIQFVFTYKDWNHQTVRRIWSRRLRTTGNSTTFLHSMDVKLSAIFAIKRLVLAAVKGESDDEIHKMIASHLRSLCQQFGTRRGDSAIFDLPPNLALYPLILYHAKRGTLLGPIMQNEDDIDQARYIFLHANRTDAIRTALPTLTAINQRGEIEEFPLEMFSLQSDRLLLLDGHSQILLWVGSDFTSPIFASFRTSCLDRAASSARFRLPLPELINCTEGSSASRWMQVRLIPTHQDNEDEQIQSFPQLQTLPPTQRQELRDKFLPTDEPTFRQFYQQLFKH